MNERNNPAITFRPVPPATARDQPRRRDCCLHESNPRWPTGKAPLCVILQEKFSVNTVRRTKVSDGISGALLYISRDKTRPGGFRPTRITCRPEAFLKFYRFLVIYLIKAIEFSQVGKYTNLFQQNVCVHIA